MEESERSHWEVQWYKEESGISQGSMAGFEGTGWWGFYPPFSRLHSSQEICSLPPHSSLCVLSSIAEFAESREEPTPARHTAAGKVGGRMQDTWKLSPVLHTPIPHPAAIKPRICTRVSLWPVLVGGQWIQVSYHRQNQQSREELSTLSTSGASPDPEGASTNRRSQAWSNESSWSEVLQLWFAVYQGFRWKLTMWFKKHQPLYFRKCFIFVIVIGLLVAVEVLLAARTVQTQLGTAKADLCQLFHAMKALLCGWFC